MTAAEAIPSSQPSSCCPHATTLRLNPPLGPSETADTVAAFVTLPSAAAPLLASADDGVLSSKPAVDDETVLDEVWEGRFVSVVFTVVVVCCCPGLVIAGLALGLCLLPECDREGGEV